jgi:hypothetical protein
MVLVVCPLGNALYDKYRNNELKVDDSLILPNVVIADACDENDQNCMKNVILINSAISLNTIESFNKLKLPENVDTVCFSSSGGNVEVSILIGNYIKKHGFNTCMASKYKIHNILQDGGVLTMHTGGCASMCPLILLMGEERYAIGGNFKIELHHIGKTRNYCICEIKTNSSDSDGDVISMLSSVGTESDINKKIDFFRLSQETDFKEDKLYRVTEDELQKYRVFTEYYSSSPLSVKTDV